MTPVCTEHQHQLFYNKKSLLDLDVPPRKLVHCCHSNRPAGITIHVRNGDGTAEGQEGEEVDGEEGEVDAYSCDEFRMYEFKVRRCARGRSHDWTDCPFAHPGEKARRRDPRLYHYSGTPCPDHRRSDGACPRGDACKLAHGVFEAWLHPARYRTMPCKDGRRCRRKVCFFAHTPAQLRVLPIQHYSSPSSPPPPSPLAHKPNCCVFWSGLKTTMTSSSPTSILMGFPHLSPPLSPPVSPPISPSGVCSTKDNYTSTKSSGPRFPAEATSSEAMNAQLLSSLEAMQLSSTGASSRGHDAGVDGGASMRVRKDLGSDHSGPDLGWVDELLM